MTIYGQRKRGVAATRPFAGCVPAHLNADPTNTASGISWMTQTSLPTPGSEERTL